MNLLNALANRWRFQTSKGNLNLEQLFQLSETELDTLYRNLESQKDKSKGLLGKKSNSQVKEKLEIIEAIYGYNREISEKNALLENNKAKRATLLRAADVKEVKELVKGKTSAQLRAEAKKL